MDSETELGDSNHLLTSCVNIVVGREERKVVEQSIMPVMMNKIFPTNSINFPYVPCVLGGNWRSLDQMFFF